LRGIELNKCAIAFAKVFKMISELENKMYNNFDFEEYKRELLVLAYICRVKILDRIEKNEWMAPEVPITIATGLFRTRKETIYSALDKSVGRIIEISDIDDNLTKTIKDILERGDSFYEFENSLPDSVLRKFK